MSDGQKALIAIAIAGVVMVVIYFLLNGASGLI